MGLRRFLKKLGVFLGREIIFSSQGVPYCRAKMYIGAVMLVSYQKITYGYVCMYMGCSEDYFKLSKNP